MDKPNREESTAGLIARRHSMVTLLVISFVVTFIAAYALTSKLIKVYHLPDVVHLGAIGLAIIIAAIVAWLITLLGIRWKMRASSVKSFDDSSVPKEKVFYETGNVPWPFLALFCAGLGVLLLVIPFVEYFKLHKRNSAIIGLGLLAFGLYEVFAWYKVRQRSIKAAKGRKPALILSDRGITTQETGFVPWSRIEGHPEISKSTRENSIYYIELTMKGAGEEAQTEFDLGYLNEDVEEIQRLIYVYRDRHDHRNA